MSPRTLTASGIESINAPSTAEVWVTLVTINHPNLAFPIRLVGNDVDIVSRGNTFTAAGLQIPLPDEEPDQLPTLDVIFSDTDQTTIQLIRGLEVQLEARPTVTLELITAGEPNDLQAGPLSFEVISSGYDENRIRLKLIFAQLERKQFPTGSVVPSAFPALFSFFLVVWAGMERLVGFIA